MADANTQYVSKIKGTNGTIYDIKAKYDSDGNIITETYQQAIPIIDLRNS